MCETHIRLNQPYDANLSVCHRFSAYKTMEMEKSISTLIKTALVIQNAYTPSFSLFEFIYFEIKAMFFTTQ